MRDHIDEYGKDEGQKSVALAPIWELTNNASSKQREVYILVDSAWPMTCVVFLVRHNSHEFSDSRRAEDGYAPPTLLISGFISPNPVPGNVLTV